MPYTKEKTKMPEGFYDLGEELKSISISMGESEDEYESPKIHYPSLYFENAEGLSKLPKEGTAVIYFKKTMEKKETVMRDGKETKRHCVELCICGIKPKGASKMESTAEKEDPEDAIEMGLAAAGESEENEEDEKD
jgi:hypothetical protein